MEGLDEGWTRLKQGTNEAIYNSIPGGNYTFRVQASDHDGRKVGEFAMAIRVKKKFYHTELFSLFLMFLMVIGVYVIILWRTAALRKRQAVLEETVEQRTMEISRQKRLVEEKVEVLQRQNEELASRKILFSEERRNGGQEEDDFVQKALDTIRQIYKKPDLDVNMFCQAMGMSKTLLNSKIQESLGQSTGQFIRTFRLSVAKEILESETGMNISEVAYEVGFNDPKYFTRCFTKEFGVNPSSINAK